MKQRWSKKQVQEKVDMFTRLVDIHHVQSDEESLLFFTEKLYIMEFKGTKSITLDTEQIHNL